MANVAGIPVWREVGTYVRRTPEPIEIAPIVVVGAGPVGLSMALDLGRRGHRVILLSLLDFIPAGSKAICFAKRSLDIFDRLGVGDAIVNKGVVWNVGKVFWGDRADPVYQFDMLPVKHQKRPSFVNIQQYHVEERLIDAIGEMGNVELRWGHRLAAIAQDNGTVKLNVESGDESYIIVSNWVIACDGSRSSTRELLGLDFEGRMFEDNFLIADVRVKSARPAERWFWFDPPFFDGKSALLHKQPDDVWRLDFQLGWNIDREAVVRPEYVDLLVRAMLGADAEFEQEWYSVYTFQCRRMHRFVHDHIIFAGDSAHLVSPFGARGCNGGLADVDNLGWKLDLVLRGEAKPGLLNSYNDEAVTIADANIRASSRSTDFMTPKSNVSGIFRQAVLELAVVAPFARPFINSGRLSVAIPLPDSKLNTRDREIWSAGVAPGFPAIDAPLGEGWLLERLGPGFTLLCHRWDGATPKGVSRIEADDNAAILLERYGLKPGSVILIRPDQYVCARWRQPSGGDIQSALLKGKGDNYD